jgi:DNA-binding CsgD family transcriptional regulator
MSERKNSAPATVQRRRSDARLGAALSNSNAGEWAALSDLIGLVYECAIDPQQWSEMLAQFAHHFGPPDWDVALLMWERMQPPGARFVGTAGFGPAVREIYQSAFAGRTLWAEKLAPLLPGRVVDTDEVLPRSEFVASPFYKDFASTWGMELAVAAILDKNGSEQLALVMPGPPNRDLEVLKRGLRLLAPHLQRAVRISRNLGEANLRSYAAQSALERAPAAVLTLSNDFQILASNSKVQALAEAGQIAVKGGRFFFSDAKAQSRLSDLAASTQPASAAFSIASLDGSDIAVLAAKIAPRSEQALLGTLKGAALIVSIGLGERAPLLEINRLRAWFGLTPSEGRLAAALADGTSVRDYAVLRNVSENAVRFLLKGVYRKVGVASQAQLVVRVRNLP